MTSEWLSRIERRFWPEGFRRDIWMIVDAARDRRIFPMLQEFHLEHYCLYSGTLPPALEVAAPYLLQLDYDDPDTHSFLGHAWGKSWGVFLVRDACERTEEAPARIPDGARSGRQSPGLSVLRSPCAWSLSAYMHSGRTAHGLRPIKRFWMEDEEPGTVLDYSFDQTHLIDRKFSLDRSEPDFSTFSGGLVTGS
jgi:hypothetical protein